MIMRQPSEPTEIAVRPLQQADADRLREIFAATCAPPSPYAARLREWLDEAVRASSTEYQALVAVIDGEPVGVALYGHVAGARGAAVLYAIVVPAEWHGHGVGRALVTAVEQQLLLGGARVAIAELPDEPFVAPLQHLLRDSGFREEARIEDFYRDGVALTLLRLDFLRPHLSGPDEAGGSVHDSAAGPQL